MFDTESIFTRSILTRIVRTVWSHFYLYKYTLTSDLGVKLRLSIVIKMTRRVITRTRRPARALSVGHTRPVVVVAVASRGRLR